MTSRGISIQLRLSKLLQSWQPFVSKEFRAHLGIARTRNRSAKKAVDPFWLRFPLWVAAFVSKGKRKISSRFLADIIWAQYCLFLFIKLHDDLFDGHTDRRILLYAGDALLLEAQRSYLKHFDKCSHFWQFYLSSLNKTLHAIVTNDQTQLQRSVSHRTIARTYAEGYSACKISLFAVCLQSRSMMIFPKLSRVFDNIAITGQLLDDYEDVFADLERGRLNYAGYWLSGKPKKRIIKNRALDEMMARSILYDGAADSFFGLLRHHLRTAQKISDTLSIQEVSDCIQSHAKTVTALEQQLHRRRVHLLFAKSSLSSKRTATRR